MGNEVDEEGRPVASFEMRVAFGKLSVINCRPHTAEKICISNRAKPGVKVEIS